MEDLKIAVVGVGATGAVLAASLLSEDPEVRQSVTEGLIVLGCTECFVVSPAGRYEELYDEGVAEMRNDIVSHLEKALANSDQGFRATATDALRSVRLCIEEEEGKAFFWQS